MASGVLAAGIKAIAKTRRDEPFDEQLLALFRNRAWVPYDTNPQTFDVVQGTRQLRATTQLHWRNEIVTDPGVIITPFAKCGTTWLQQMVHSLRTGGDLDFDDI